MDNFKRRYHLCLEGIHQKDKGKRAFQVERKARAEVEGEAISIGKISCSKRAEEKREKERKI